MVKSIGCRVLGTAHGRLMLSDDARKALEKPVKADTETPTEYPGRWCRICFMDYRKEVRLPTPKDMAEHAEATHKGEVGSFLQRR